MDFHIKNKSGIRVNLCRISNQIFLVRPHHKSTLSYLRIIKLIIMPIMIAKLFFIIVLSLPEDFNVLLHFNPSNYLTN